MKMAQSERASLWDEVISVGALPDGLCAGVDATVAWGDLVRGSCLGGRAEELRGRSVLVSTSDQLTAALALIELDGVARRLVLCPSDLPPQHVPFVIKSADVDAIVSDQLTSAPGVEMPSLACFVTCSSKIVSAEYDRSVACATEWILLTSGTTGVPKLVVHTLAS